MTRPEEFIEPELTPAQQDVKTITDEVLAQKPEQYSLTFWELRTQVSASRICEKLRETQLVEIMLQEGESLSATPPNDYWNDLNLFATNETLKWASIRAWGWQYDKVRTDPSGPQEPPYDIVIFPGEKDWVRQLDIKLAYSNDLQTATQSITAYTSSFMAGQTPHLSRDVYAIAYAETGYEGHKQKHLENVTEEQVLAFTGICRYLMEHPKPA